MHRAASDQVCTLYRLDSGVGRLSARPHRHDFYEIIWFRQARGLQRIDFEEYLVVSGQFTFLTPGQVHQLRLQERNGLMLTFRADWLDQKQGLLQYPLFHRFGTDSSLRPSGADAQALEALMHLLQQEYERADASAIILRGYLRLLLDTAARCYSSDMTSGAGNGDVQRINQLRALIEQHYQSHHDAVFYAAFLHLTPKRVNEITRRLMGQTITAMVHERLNLEARRMVGFDTGSVKEIAFALGFEDPSYFTRFFRKHNGCTPEAFRGQCSKSTSRQA
jgi:AraC-like DNA-binding protein